MDDNLKFYLELFNYLRLNPNKMPWQEKRDLLTQCYEMMMSTEALPNPVVDIIILLSYDPKWEVRKVIADHLTLLSDEFFTPLTARLIEDCNFYVKNSAERALSRRQSGEKPNTEKKNEDDYAFELKKNFEKKYGHYAAAEAHHIAEHMYGVLAGSTVHDMKGILTPLKSNAQVLLDSLQKSRLNKKQLKETIETMQSRIGLMESLMDDMQSYSQLSPPVRFREELLSLTKEALKMSREILSGRGYDTGKVAVEIDIPKNIHVHVSRHQMLIALTNIIKNAFEAFEYVPGKFKKGRISIRSLNLEKDKVWLVVQDNGMGLDRDELKTILRFIPGKTSKKYGTGFGLPIAKRKIAAHGGSISIESEDENGRTVFITLPLAPNE